ncbi:hypothetical protein REH65_32330 [Saccharopolyspora sp. ID03-671]|uniref:hypothetical protein n=1 Tax=Saccharopolyspora sp. ID03-671 TaxID=3073066 RepID=UPI003248C96A
MHQLPRDVFNQIQQSQANSTGAPDNELCSVARLWDVSEPANMRAVLLGHLGIELIELPRTQPLSTIADLVGDPVPERVQYTPDVLVWVGDNSRYSAPPNEDATGLVCELICDVANGTYSSTEHGRAHAERLAATPDFIPHLHGRVLLTGADLNSEPAPFSDAFRGWFGAIIEQAARAAEAQAQAVIDVVQHLFGPLDRPNSDAGESDRPDRN